MQKNRLSLLLMLVVLAALMIPSHVIGIDKFATIDEPWWVISGSNFYYAITHHDFASTIYDYHPAVTTTWIVMTGMLAYFPEYRGFGQGYFDVRKDTFDNFLKEHGKQTLDLLRDSRLIQTAVLVALALLAFFLLQLLIDRIIAFLAILLAVDAPFFLGHSRLLNHEGMLSMFILVSMLSMLVYLHRGRKWMYLVISGAAFGLAQLTKSPSIVVVPVVGLMLFVGLFERESGKKFLVKLLDAVKVLGIWLVAAVIVYVALWPGMWVAPGKMLYEVYGNAFSYAFQGARLDVTQELQPAKFSLNTGISGAGIYLLRWLTRSTLITWLGVILAIFVLFSKKKEIVPSLVKWLIGYLAVMAFLFIVMFGVAQGRDSPHYILTSFVCLDVIAGIGWGFALIWSSNRWPVLKKSWAALSVLAVLIALQIGSTLPYYPYYYTYENPIMQVIVGNSPYGYGEGLDQAAAYLAQKRDASATKVYAYAGMGPFSYFFPGETDVLKKVYLSEDGLLSIIEGMKHADYLVLYSAVQDSLPESAKLYQALKDVPPEKVISIYGQEYARIYRIVDIPESVYEAMAH